MRRQSGVLGVLLLLLGSAAAPAPRQGWRSPIDVAVSGSGRFAYVVEHTADAVAVLDLDHRQVVASIAVGRRPVQAVVAPDDRWLYVSCLHDNRVDVVDLGSFRVVRSIAAGFEPNGLALSHDGARLYVVNAISGTLQAVDAATGRSLWTTPVGEQPRYVAITKGGRLLVANGLSRSVSILDGDGQLLETRILGRASILRGIQCSPDGRYAAVAHLVSHDEVVPLQLERGWIHSNGISLLDLDQPGHFATLLLDRLDAGAAFPWGVAFAADGKRLCVTLAGVHEVAIVDVEAALALVRATPAASLPALALNVDVVERRGIARRVPAGGDGPRGLAVRQAAGELLVADYFADTVSVLDLATGALRATVPLGPPPEPTLVRRGEMLFNDARVTYQGWFSCASCHQEDATMDGLNWDLPNDGTGNTKNAKSLHDIADTPPAMWSGVREDMPEAVAAGQRFMGFLPRPEQHAALLAFLGAIERAPNPWRTQDAALLLRGERAFRQAGCATCHPAPLYTDLQKYDLGLSTVDDYEPQFDTPSLRECYRTAPYLHDGRARTLRELWTVHDPDGRHGAVAELPASEFEAMLAFLRSL